MSADEAMWTPLEAALSPFKELARLNRQTVIGSDGEPVQLVLQADRCRVHPGAADGDPGGRTIDLGFRLDRAAYAVRLVAGAYRREGRWDFERLRADISAGLQSGALTPEQPLALGGASG